MATQLDSRQIKKRIALLKLGAAAGATLESILDKINVEFDAPLRMAASAIPDAVLNFSSSLVSSADSTNKVMSAVSNSIYVGLNSPTINFQTQALSNPSDFVITFPASTVGQFRHCAFTLNTAGKIEAVFSAEAASEGALVNPGTLFVVGAPIGYVTLICTNASGLFKTAGSATNIIENSKIFRLSSGGGSVDLSTYVVGPASATDNALARYDLTTGKLIQNSSAILSDAGVLTGLTGLTTSGTLSSTGNITASGYIIQSANTANSQTGDNVNITSSSSVIRLTSASLSSIGGIASTTAGIKTILLNATANYILINDEDTVVTATNRIRNGLGATAALPPNASVELIYNATTQRHHVIGSIPLAQFIVATGGTITTDGNFRVHTFTSSSSFQITQTSNIDNNIQYLYAAGGGGGGFNVGGGGGAGGLLNSSTTATVTTLTVTIGGGGAGGVTDRGTSGSNTTITGLTTAVGGGGGGRSSVGNFSGANGGSGGGAGGDAGASAVGGTGTGGQGNNGAGASGTGATGGAGGGGGAGGAGAQGNGNTFAGGNGGAGINSSISGSSVGYAGGGGAGRDSAGVATHGGGSRGNAGTANRGGGGGGSATVNGNGFAGGSGIAIFRYRFQ